MDSLVVGIWLIACQAARALAAHGPQG